LRKSGMGAPPTMTISSLATARFRLGMQEL
jgi:hypothetical protein